MNDLQNARVIDADFEIVGGPYRIGEEHRRERGWFFTGHYDDNGDPLFVSQQLLKKVHARTAERIWIRRWILLPIAVFAAASLAACLFLAVTNAP